MVFADLQKTGWGQVPARIGRPYANLADACNQAVSLTDHHDWVSAAATKLVLPGETLWQAMCAEWAALCLDAAKAKQVIQPIADLLLASPTSVSSPTVRLPLFEQSRDAFEDQADLQHRNTGISHPFRKYSEHSLEKYTGERISWDRCRRIITRLRARKTSCAEDHQ